MSGRVDDHPPKRSLADDPIFLASLDDLDTGLIAGTKPAAPVTSAPASPPPAGPATHAVRKRPLLDLFPQAPAASSRQPHAPPPAVLAAPRQPSSPPPPTRAASPPSA